MGANERLSAHAHGLQAADWVAVNLERLQISRPSGSDAPTVDGLGAPPRTISRHRFWASEDQHARKSTSAALRAGKVFRSRATPDRAGG